MIDVGVLIKKTEMKNALKLLEKNHNKQCKRQFFDIVMKKKTSV